MRPPDPEPHAAGAEGPEPLDGRIRALEAAVQRLESRLAVLEDRSPARRAAAAEAETPEEVQAASSGTSPLEVVGLVGRVCLVLAGAFLIRALSDSGRIPLLAGVSLGLAYGLLWAFMADRAGRAGRRLGAAFYTITAALVCFPLLGEATLKFQVLPPWLAAGALGAVTVLLAAVAWRQDLHGVFWASTLAALGTALVLMVGTKALEAFTPLLLILGAASLWLTYGRRWHGIRWPVALAADGAVFAFTSFVAWRGGPPEAYRHLAPGQAILLGLALVAVYLGSLSVRILQRHRAVNPFEALQAAVALAVGFGGALRVAHASGSGETGLGLLAFACGAACYALAFAFVERQTETGANFAFFSSLALVFVLSGCLIALPGALRILGLGLLGLLSLGLALRFRREVLLAHGTVALAAAALDSGLVARSLEVLLRPASATARSFPFPALLVLAALGLGHAVAVWRRPSGAAGWRWQVPSLGLAALALLGASTLAMATLSRAVAGEPPDPAQLAVARTGVLAAAALLLASSARWAPGSEAAWLVYPVLGLAGIKLLLEDFPKGSPLTLFLALAMLGAAMILSPWLLRSRKPSGAGAGDGEDMAG